MTQKMDVSERAINGSAIGPTWHQINFLLEPWSVLTCDRTAWKKVRLLNGTEIKPFVGKFRDIEMGAILIMSTLDLNGYLSKNTQEEVLKKSTETERAFYRLVL